MWTDKQKLAIDKKNANILVAANAGSGKTAVLVERIISKILNDMVNIDELLIVTFTNAAASEMKEKISKAIYEKLDENPDNSHLKKQISLLNKANINTIHSFCLNVIRENFYLINIDSNISIGDTAEINMLKRDSLSELLEDVVINDNVFLSKYMENSGYKEDEFVDMFLKIYNYIQSFPYPYKWLSEQIDKFDISKYNNIIETDWGRHLFNNIKRELDILLNDTSECLYIIKDTDLEQYYDTVKSDEVQIKKALEAKDWDELYNNISLIKFDKLPQVRGTAYPGKKEEFKNIRYNIKTRIYEHIQAKHIYSNSKNLLEDISYLFGDMKDLYNLIIKFNDIYEKKKKTRNIIDFNDIEHMCLKLLVDEEKGYIPTEVAKKYKEKFNEIYIDEYQDSNYTQEYILSTVSREDIDNPNRFMVGDIKQSIYRFRQAMPEIFSKKYSEYSSDEESSYLKILFSKNFRSRKNILDSTNYIFSYIMSQQLGSVNYKETDKLTYGSNMDESIKQDYSTEVNVILSEDEENIHKNSLNNDESFEGDNLEEDSISEIKNSEIEAEYISNRIIKLMGNFGREEKYKIIQKDGTYRDIEYKDIVILMRSPGNISQIYSKIFLEKGIPLYTDTNIFLDTEEVNLIISILSIIDNQYQDIPLISVLYSPIFNFSLDELMKIRIYDKKSYFYIAMQKAFASEEGKLKDKISRFFNFIDEFREIATITSVSKLLVNIYNKLDIYNYLIYMINGKQKILNINTLLELAEKYEKTTYKGLYNYINYIKRVKQTKTDISSASIVGEGENVVRLMSIHKSKGLEFPIVILADTSRKFNFKDLNKDILLHNELGIGANIIDTDRRIKYPSICKESIKVKLRQESLAEELRLLYVAMTRAKEKLIITAVLKNIKQIEKNNLDSREIKPERVMNNINFISNILMCLYKHRGLYKELNLNLENTVKDDSVWKLNILKKDFISKENIKFDLLEKWNNYYKSNKKINKNNIKNIHEMIEYQYKYIDVLNIQSKLSVSEVNKKIILGNENNIENIIDSSKKIVLPIPKYIKNYENKEISGAEYGTLMHYIMQNLEYRNVKDIQDIELQIKELKEKEYINDNEYNAIDKNKILNFVNSPIGNKIKLSNCVKKEVPFVLNKKVKEIYNEINCEDDEKLLIQGIIDLYFLDDDNKAILIDFKTDKILNEEEVIKKYKVQLESYKEALELIMKIEVKEIYIYSFDIDKFIRII